MAYSVPTFPLSVNVWRFGNPTSNPPDLVTVGNLALGRRVTTQWWNWGSQTFPSLFNVLLVPASTDVRGWNDAVGRDTVECPAGSRRYYTVEWVDDSGKGFANEHRVAVLSQQSPWPAPIP
jgi:hypothetical protein